MPPPTFHPEVPLRVLQQVPVSMQYMFRWVVVLRGRLEDDLVDALSFGPPHPCQLPVLRRLLLLPNYMGGGEIRTNFVPAPWIVSMTILMVTLHTCLC